MHPRPTSLCRALALGAGLITAPLALAAPAASDPGADAFIGALADAGVGTADPANTVALGQSVCPMLAEPGQTAADVAATLAEAGGMPLGGAPMFTGIAITMFCPTAVSSIGSGSPPIPLSILGF